MTETMTVWFKTLSDWRLGRLLMHPGHGRGCCQGYIEEKLLRACCAISSGWLNVYVNGAIVLYHEAKDEE